MHARPAEWPELKDLLGAFRVRFRRPEGGQAWERYLTGRRTELPTKNCETMAQAVPGASAQRLPEFLTNMQWDAEDLNRQRVLPAAATGEELAGYAHRRYAVEQFHAEATGEVGWDQDQGRLWPGFHRHAVTVMPAYSFLVWLELRQRCSQPRRGRPRAPFSPSAGSSAALAASDPSRGRPVAAPPRRSMVGDNGAVHGTLLTKDLTE